MAWFSKTSEVQPQIQWPVALPEAKEPEPISSSWSVPNVMEFVDRVGPVALPVLVALGCQFHRVVKGAVAAASITVGVQRCKIAYGKFREEGSQALLTRDTAVGVSWLAAGLFLAYSALFVPASEECCSKWIELRERCDQAQNDANRQLVNCWNRFLPAITDGVSSTG